MNKFESLFAAVAAAAMLGACSSTPVAPATAPAAPAAKTGAAATPSSGTAQPASSSVASVTVLPHKDPNSLISRERSIYFDYDDDAIKSQGTAVVENHGKYLMAHPALAVRIEGNADERGSAEYNLALGQRRAEAVLRAMKIYGVKDSQMEPVSFGEERPKATGHDEAAWAQNRRADIAYKN